jgi:hypothetical protein
MPDLNTKGLVIRKPATNGDRYEGGLSVYRDASKLDQTWPDHVNTTIYSYTLTGKADQNFSWGYYSEVDNWSDKGENVAIYAKNNKFGVGPSFALVSEVCCLNPNDTAGQVSYECDVWTAGPDSGNRIGIDLTIADARTVRDAKLAPGVAEGTAGIRVGTYVSHPGSAWTYGIKLQNNIKTGIHISDAKCKDALVLNKDQVIKIGDLELTYDDIKKLKGGKVPSPAPTPVPAPAPPKPTTKPVTNSLWAFLTGQK